VAAAKQAMDLAKDTFKSFLKDEATWKAAALAYYTVFALAPLLVILLQVASLVWDPAEVRRTLSGEFRSLMGADVARQIETMMTSAEEKTASGTGLRLLLSIGGLVFGATGAFVSLQTALNRAWGVEPDPKRGGIMNFITKRFLSLGMLLGIGFLLLVSLALTAALGAVGGVIFGGLGEVVAQALNFAFSFAVVTFLFAAIFKVLPDAKVVWRDVWAGAVATAIFFVIGKFLIGLYIGQSDPGNAFGAAGSLAVLLVWIYYAAIILLLGAEFTQAWVRQRGRTIEPEEGAVRVVERKVRVDGSAANGSEATSEAKPEPMDDVQRDIAAARERVSSTVAQIDARVSSAVVGVKQKLDAASLVREHPWPALAAAVVAGVTLSATRADEKAVAVAVDATKRASDGAAERVARKVTDLTDVAVSRFQRESDEAVAELRDGFVERLQIDSSEIE
jgi:membrane protein